MNKKLLILCFTAILCIVFWSQKSFASKNWMKSIDDNQSIAKLSIPGTHNSGTYDYKADPATKKWVKCQSHSIGVQLEMGVRFLDIRAGLNKKNELMIYHGSHRCERSVNQVMLSVRNFLAENPSETVICRFDNEYGDKNEIISKIENLLYNNYGNYIYDKQEIPKMGECRGKIIYWKNYDSNNGLKFSIPKNFGYDDLMPGWKKLTSNYYGATPDLKLSSIRSYIHNSEQLLNYYKNVFGFLFASGYHSSMPFYSPIGMARVVNPELKKYLANSNCRCYGIIAVDFVDQSLSNSIWSCNFR